MSRLAFITGLLTCVAFWVFLLTGHGEGTEMLGAAGFALTVVGISEWSPGHQDEDRA
jgi:hypothetical protein